MTHYAKTPSGVCEDKDKADMSTTTVVSLNKDVVTCRRCRTYMQANKKKKARMLETAFMHTEMVA